MDEQSSSNINKENKKENRIGLFKFDNIFKYIKKIINKIINKSKADQIMKENKKINIINSKIKENPIRKRNNKDIIIKNYILIILIKFLILNIYCQRKINIYYYSLNFQYSKIILKIKGIGENLLFANGKYAFQNIKYLNSVYINGNKQDTIEYKYYFNQTENSVELIWDDNIDSCANLFRQCSNITEIDLSYFNTSQVINMTRMFSYCTSLTSLNLSYFDTTQVINMEYVFYNCISLTSLNLSNFNTSKVLSMHGMFYKCSSLTTLNLSNFETKELKNMKEMFYCCSSLTSIDLSNFNTKKVKNMNKMFYGCINLEYINLNNFNENKIFNNITYYIDMFYNIPMNAIICINENITKSKIFPQIKNNSCFVIDCTNGWQSKQKKIINNANLCIESCDISSQYQYEYNGKCYDNCPKGLLNDDDTMNKCKCELDMCLLCPNVALNKRLCTQCNINYYPKENDLMNIGNYINCYKELEGYYLDNNIYKKCYFTCKICDISGNKNNHNCIVMTIIHLKLIIIIII